MFLKGQDDALRWSISAVLSERNALPSNNAGPFKSLKELFLTSIKKAVLREDSTNCFECAVRTHRHFYIDDVCRLEFCVHVHEKVSRVQFFAL